MQICVHCGPTKLMAQSRSKADWPTDLEVFDERLRVVLRQARYSLSPWPSSLSLDAYWMRRSHLYRETRGGGLSWNCQILPLNPNPSWLMFGVFVTRLILVTLSDSVSRDGRLIKQESVVNRPRFGCYSQARIIVRSYIVYSYAHMFGIVQLYRGKLRDQLRDHLGRGPRERWPQAAGQPQAER